MSFLDWIRSRNAPTPERYPSTAPGHWSDRSGFQRAALATYPLHPRNDFGASPIRKVTETVAAGEQREVFSALSAASNVLLTNNEPRQVEVCEIFIYPTTAGNFQIFNGIRPMTPIIALVADQFYSDAGFPLETNGQAILQITGGGVCNGFLRWRYV